MSVSLPTRPPHSGNAANSSSFDEAYRLASEDPGRSFETEGLKAAFQVIATKGMRGLHSGKRVLRFMNGRIEKARAYECCWGHQTNCNRTYIHMYSELLSQSKTEK